MNHVGAMLNLQKTKLEVSTSLKKKKASPSFLQKNRIIYKTTDDRETKTGEREIWHNNLKKGTMYQPIGKSPQYTEKAEVNEEGGKPLYLK